MFDWNDQDQVGLTIWGELNDTEDHIVPYPKDTEENIIFTFNDRNKKPSNQDANTTATSTGQSSGAKNDFPGSILENSTSLIANEQSGHKIDMDTWSDLLSLNSELSTRELPSLDGESELFGNVPEDKQHNSFLGCDWDNIGDFDDLSRIFRDDSIFGQDMIPSVDDILAPSADLTGSTSQSDPISDIPLSTGQDQGCSSFQSTEPSGRKRKAEDKVCSRKAEDKVCTRKAEDKANVLETREQTIHRIHNTNQLTEKDDRKKKLLRSRKKAEERSKNKASEIKNGPWSQNIPQTQQFTGQNVQLFDIIPSQAVHSLFFTQTRQVSDTDNQFLYSQYGYPAYPFPATPVLQHFQVPEIQSKSMAMTPQEKIEKLRQRQQAQAMLSIQKQQQQQQQQQLVHQNTGGENMASQANFMRNTGVTENENNLSSSDLNLLAELDESTLTDDISRKTIYYRLQDTVGKLDNRVRLCIRDSLLRLARSSMERQNASGINSTITSTRDDSEVSAAEAATCGKGHAILQDEETYTNPIDRTVAHLLFHKTSESCMTPMNDEMRQSRFLCSAVSNLPQNIPESMSEREPEIFGEMELQPSVSSKMY